MNFETYLSQHPISRDCSPSKEQRAALPDLFHTSRGHFSERARVVIEKSAPGQVEFIPVEIGKAPTSWLNPFIDAYYSMKDLCRPVAAMFIRGQVDFLLVSLEPKPRITVRLNLASAYYFINVLGRAQRLLWLQMPTLKYRPRDDGTELFGLVHDFGKWKLSQRASGEPLIWRDTKWQHGNNEYSGQNEVLIEDALWRELDAHFPNQLHPMRAGEVDD
jgi:hypothetical protein